MSKLNHPTGVTDCHDPDKKTKDINNGTVGSIVLSTPRKRH